MRRFVGFTLLFSLLALEGFSQLGYIPYRTRRFTGGLDVGIGSVHGDVSRAMNPRPLLTASLAYNHNPFVSIGADLTGGVFEAVSNKSGLISKLKSTNVYQSFNLNWRVALGSLVGSKPTFWIRSVSGLYVGAGIGVLRNNITSIVETFSTGKPIVNGIKKQTIAAYIPLNIGWDYELPSKGAIENLSLHLAFQYGYVFSDYVDGYKLDIKANRSNDGFTSYSAGIRWHFGRLK